MKRSYYVTQPQPAARKIPLGAEAAQMPARTEHAKASLVAPADNIRPGTPAAEAERSQS